MLKSDAISNPFKNPFFWLIVGLVLVNLIGFFLLSPYNYIVARDKALVKALKALNKVFTNVQYICMLAYFFCLWKKWK
jgi:hypothetical protein